jgi:hypothetical protein
MSNRCSGARLSFDTPHPRRRSHRSRIRPLRTPPTPTASSPSANSGRRPPWAGQTQHQASAAHSLRITPAIWVAVLVNLEGTGVCRKRVTKSCGPPYEADVRPNGHGHRREERPHRVGAGNSVRRSDLLVFVVGRSWGHAHPKLELPASGDISRFARGNTDLVSNRNTSARATRTGLHKDPVSREHHPNSQVRDVTEFPAPTGAA